ncbi:hypothetical protein AGMMS49982_24130 [Bacteroidia bacterium]|nr:hypothetical protein AGMMS49982_24130 [Bacteroidia bacterium]
MKAEKLIKASLEELVRIDSEGGEPPTSSSSRLIFPITRNKERRVSEQEAKFLFAKQLENQTDFYYSVETPTEETYRFSGVPEPQIDPDGLSARIDICLYKKVGSKYEREHLIEFKAHNVDVADFKKDFLKLFLEKSTGTNYFVHVIKSFNNNTIDSLKKKYKSAFKFGAKEKNRNDVKVYLCVLEPMNIIYFDANERDCETELNKLRKI